MLKTNEVYIGGKARVPNDSNARQPAKPKSIVVGLLERGGRVRPTVISDTSANTMIVADLELAKLSVQTIDDP